MRLPAVSAKRSFLGLGLIAGLTALGTAGVMHGLPQTLPAPQADPSWRSAEARPVLAV